MKTVLVTLLALIVGCTAVQPASAASAVTYKVMWSFGSGTDGAVPYANLIDVNGILYGTTANGGGSGCGGYGCGTVFSLDPGTGTEKVLYSFCRRTNCRDGAFPDAGLIAVNGTLYGTTDEGGRSSGNGYCYSYGCGTVFSLDPTTGAEKALYSFCTYPICADGAHPDAGLVAMHGTLYGTTEAGGNFGDGGYGYGTVFSLDPDKRAEKALYRFCSQYNCSDGAYPFAGVTDMNGTLYGTTVGGGRPDACNTFTVSCGIVYSLDPGTGATTVIYSFCSQKYCTDGSNPTASPIAVNGKLYGTTYAGGNKNCGGYTCGTVFSLDPGTDTETVLHAFLGGADGANPRAGLTEHKGTLYGTTYDGGGTGCYGGYGCGTVFSLDPDTGVETVLYSFCAQQNCTDGATPYASLTAVNGSLYGTTSAGGAYAYGTVFELSKNR